MVRASSREEVRVTNFVDIHCKPQIRLYFIRRTISSDLHDELLEEMDGNPSSYSGDSPQHLAAEIAQGTPYVVLLLTGRVLRQPQPVFYHTTTPRLGRRDASANDNNSRPPFAPRLGRNLPFSPRLGRSFSAPAVDSFGY